MKSYHAHVYFHSDELEAARSFRARASSQTQFDFSGIAERPVGPHPLGMVELHFNETQLNWARTWLEQNRKAFSVLIHEDTADDIKDHTENIQWLGAPVKLDFSFFELIKTRPDLVIHKK